ncbi:MFS transporter [Mucilaginibacter daejeonensis]|uniref:MFS transporter n=1 Tax=Mucilaginibacter daejeonensis TaxID=398049 RepID=UPI001D174A63|nr:MFS transporter [Mucilaginibacter daejeonensis]UEG54770.1 MFS transporter [Mucilaginibacter daejeonensis]
MNLRPSEKISAVQLNRGLDLVIADGLSAEAMVVFTSGTFLTAMALNMGATNFQLGILAALPTFTTMFQLAAIWMVQRFNNRKAVTALFNFLARLPLLAIGVIPFLFTKGTSVQVLIMLLFFQHIFGDIGGAAWNSWMKDLIPGERLGSFFSKRSRLAQTLNVTLSLATAVGIDYVKTHYPHYEILTYNLLFMLGGVLGMISVGLLLRTPEPKAAVINDKLFTLFSKPLRNTNFRNLLIFNSFWAFALNLATPFFAVYMMRTLGISVAYIIGLGIVGQISSIISLKLWGRYSDRFSNKNIIGICGPTYVACIIAFAFTAMPGNSNAMLTMLAVIHILSGVSTAGINLAISNIGIKLAPNSEAIAYISTKNMLVAFFSTIAPMIGGSLADFFASHQLNWTIQWTSAHGVEDIKLLALQGWNYFFVIGGLLALLSLRLLHNVKERGEIDRQKLVLHMRSRLRSRLRANLGRRVADGIYYPSTVVRKNMSRLFRPQHDGTYTDTMV